MNKVIDSRKWRIRIVDLLRPFKQISDNLMCEFDGIELSFFIKDNDEVLYWNGRIAHHIFEDLDIDINFCFQNKELMEDQEMVKNTIISITPLRRGMTIKEMIWELKDHDVYIEIDGKWRNLMIRRNGRFERITRPISSHQIVVRSAIHVR